MTSKNRCIEIFEKYQSLQSCIDKFKKLSINKTNRLALLELKNEITEILTSFEVDFPKEVHIVQFIDRQYVNSRTSGFSRFVSEIKLLRAALDVDWVYLNNLANYHWVGLFVKNSKYYLVFDEIDESRWDEYNNLEKVAKWDNERKWLGLLRAFQFDSKEKIIKYLLRNVEILAPLETVEVLNALDPKAGEAYIRDVVFKD